MIIVGGTFEVDPEHRDNFIAVRTGIMQKSRSEDGCIDYAFCADPLEPGRVILFERWESEEHLAAHLAGLPTAAPPAGSPLTPLSASVTFYEATERERPGAS